MALRQRLGEVRSEGLRLLRDAASRVATSETMEITSELEAIESLEREYLKLEAQLEKLSRNLLLHAVAKDELKSVATTLIYSPESGDQSYDSIAAKESLSPRELGKIQRRKFLSKIEAKEAIHLYPRKGVLHTTETGDLVALGFAAERRKGRFFLGVPDQNYQAVVLLCKPRVGNTLEFILPGDVIGSMRNDLEIRGQLKFNVISRNGEYLLAIRGGRKIDLIEFQSNYQPLRVEHHGANVPHAQPPVRPPGRNMVGHKIISSKERKQRDVALERKTKLSLGVILKTQGWGNCTLSNHVQLVFESGDRRVLALFSTYDQRARHWFWGVTQKYWAMWKSNDYLALIIRNEEGDGFSYMLLDSATSRDLFSRLRPAGDFQKKINLAIDKSSNLPKFTAWKEFNAADNIHDLPNQATEDGRWHIGEEDEED